MVPRFYNICLRVHKFMWRVKQKIQFWLLFLSLLLDLVISGKWKREPLSAIFHGILEKLVAHRYPLYWVKNCLDGWSQKVVVNGVASHWHLITSGVSQGSVLGLALFSTFIDDLDDGIKCKFTDDAKLSGSIYLLRDRKVLEWDLHRLNLDLYISKFYEYGIYCYSF